MSHPELDKLGYPEWYESYQMQVYLARDGWPKKFVEVGPGTGLTYLRTISQQSGRDIQVLHVTTENSEAVGKGFDDGAVNFVFLDLGDDYDANVRAFDVWWPKIRVSGWIGGHAMTMPNVARAVADVFRLQYATSDKDVQRVVQIGHSWNVPKLQEQINWPFNPNYFNPK